MAAKVTAKFSEFKEYLIAMLGNMYVLGAQGQGFVDLLDKVCAMEKEDIDLVANVLTLLKKKIKEGTDINDLLSFDCSGLGMFWLMQKKVYKYDLTAKGLYESIPEKVTGLENVKAGDFVFTNNLGHVGYAIGNNQVIEARGTAYGVVQTDLFKREWKKIARPDWWSDLDDKPVLRRELKLTNPYMRGDDVMEAQRLLEEKGYDPGAVDGIFGNKTEQASKDFKKDNGLKHETGTIGKKTAEKLGFIWEG